MEQPSRIYESDAIAVAWYPARCIHAAQCSGGLPDVFNAARKPWVVLDGHTADEIAAVINRCPSGALHFTRKDGGAAEPTPTETTVTPVTDGPLFVRGDVTVMDEQGNVLRCDTRLALCRCGGSANKPFCDGTHVRIGFRTGADGATSQETEKSNKGATSG